MTEYKLASEIIAGDIIIDNGIEKVILSACKSNDPRLKDDIIIEFKKKDFKRFKHNEKFEIKNTEL